MLKNKVGIINNMNAKKNKSGRYTKETMQPILGELGFVIDTYSIEEMEKAVDFLIEKNVDFVGVNGGDGSVQKFLTTWINKAGENNLPKLIPFAGGSTNAILSYLEQKMVTPIVTLKKFVSKVKTYQLLYAENNLLKISLDEDDFTPIYGFSFANGVVYKVVELYLENNKPGVAWVMQTIMQIIGGISMRMDKYLYYINPINEKFVADGKIFPEQKIKATLVTSFSKPFPTFTIFKNVHRNIDEAFYLVASLSFPALINNIHNILFGLGDIVVGDGGGDIWIDSAKEINLKTKAGFMLDGELYKPESQANINIISGPAITIVIV